ncbi:aminopeptidase C [Listeria ivanovii]|uniref:Aminopeptidase n=1 Tax=Listeria ivanovii (strain ATCC BAA-678 / PAM 55) TaxID=881621 RepID=G2ZEG5_LISIP|nr:aminopeptidase C [Listeria ivanovii]AHI56784.1 aminopeptidase C [Listeria ivanovii WSLC3009]AIS66201.1 aminopeptidase C [Listeria ivanovii subsp. ivanovii]MBC1760440.1 aminopeptidase C [Listeria ivanovii]MBK3913779.1 aminopeptidase C [Listeria ivanovii subsp. ivanovii]MBK3921383.1 aminopeptidase C [Listeria ivanovii subsp. ivanovii]
MSTELTFDQLNSFSKKWRENPDNMVIQASIMKNGIKAATENPVAKVKVQPIFSHEVTTDKVSNQQQSGRCWMFAALNTFRHKLNGTLGLKDFELSQNYTNFWDKLEKANYFLENIIETAQEDEDSRLVSWLLDTPQQDGGQWDMLVSIIEKYGIVPKSAMPETFQSSKSADLNHLLNERLRTDAVILRKAVKNKVSVTQLKEEMLAEIYQLLVMSLGEPPKTFDFEYRNKDNEFKQALQISPTDFFKRYIDIDLRDYVPLINAPTKDKPFNQVFTVDYLGNIVGGAPIRYLNVEMDVLKKAAAKQIQNGETVWFGCDVGQLSERTSGIMDTNIFLLNQAFGFKTTMTKAERLDYKHSMLTHAMVLTGVNVVDGEVNRWKVENSWGEAIGNKGYFVASDAWMDEFTFQVVVRKKYLSDELLNAFKQEPITLKPWDPMGSLAFK